MNEAQAWQILHMNSFWKKRPWIHLIAECQQKKNIQKRRKENPKFFSLDCEAQTELWKIGL